MIAACIEPVTLALVVLSRTAQVTQFGSGWSYTSHSQRIVPNGGSACVRQDQGKSWKGQRPWATAVGERPPVRWRPRAAVGADADPAGQPGDLRRFTAPLAGRLA